METVKWYKSSKPVSEELTQMLVHAAMHYYRTETVTDQTKLFTALGNYYLKTPKPEALEIYFKAGNFKECEKPARKNLSPL